MKNKKEVHQNPRLYVPFWFGTHKARFIKELPKFAELWLDYIDALTANNFNQFTPVRESNMEKAFNLHMHKMPLIRLEEMSNRLKCTGPNTDLLKNWLRAVATKATDLDLQVMAHWCWLVKRKALGLPVVHHIMPIISGGQRTGKSTAVEHLIGPLGELKLDMDVDELCNKTLFASLANNVVVFFDELSGMPRVDMEVLKKQITTLRNSYRPLYQQQVVSEPQRCSFIACSNKRINESIVDATGMGRFYEILSPAKLDRATINSLDYTALWRGIDETLPQGYLLEEQLDAMYSAQTQYVNETEFSYFVNEHMLKPPTSDSKKLIQGQALYAVYREWAIRSGFQRPQAVISFNRSMRNGGYEEGPRVGSTRAVSFYINDASVVFAAPRPIRVVAIEDNLDREAVGA